MRPRATLTLVLASLLVPRAVPAQGFHRATATIDTLLRTPGPSWDTGHSRHFILHLESPASASAVPAMLDSLEAAWDNAVVLLNVVLTGRPPAHVFVTASRTRFADLVAPTDRGLTTRLLDLTDVIVLVRNDSVRAYVRHEVMHLVSFASWGAPGTARAWLAEGLATFADGHCQQTTISAVSRDLLAAQPALTATDLQTTFRDRMRNDRAASYVLAGTFVDYLLASRGRDGVRRLWQGIDSLSEIGVLPGLGGDLTNSWRAYVLHRAGQVPGISVERLQRGGCG